MKKCIYKFCLLFSILGFGVVDAKSQSFSTASFAFSRSTSMGGAFTAVEDGVENVLFNPAAMNYTDVGEKVRFYLNPLGAAAALQDLQSLTSNAKRRAEDWLALGGLLLKNISFSNSNLQLSLLFSEDLRDANLDTSGSAYLDARGLFDENYHAVAGRVSLAKQVSIGASAYFFNLYNKKTFGSSYGIIIRPSDKIQAGISYYTFPQGVDSLMLGKYSLTNKTINVGISWAPIYQARLALDVRNVSGEDAASPNEIHAGIELLPSYRIAFRAGYFKRGGDVQKASIGFGIGDFRPFRAETDFVFSNFLLNYALQVDINKSSLLNHYLTFFIRF